LTARHPAANERQDRQHKLIANQQSIFTRSHFLKKRRIPNTRAKQKLAAECEIFERLDMSGESNVPATAKSAGENMVISSSCYDSTQ